MRTSEPRATVPSSVPATTGEDTLSVISVWPPTSATSAAAQAAVTSASSAWISGAVVPAGASTVARSQRGSAPVTAQVVPVHRQQIGPDVGGGERDGIGGGYQQVRSANVNHGGILTGLSANQDRRIPARNPVKRLSQERKRQLAGREVHERAATECFT